MSVGCPDLDHCSCDWRYVDLEADGELICRTDCGITYSCGEHMTDADPDPGVYPEEVAALREALRRPELATVRAQMAREGSPFFTRLLEEP